MICLPDVGNGHVIDWFVICKLCKIRVFRK